MPQSLRLSLAISLAFFPLAGIRTGMAQESSAPAEAVVFAPGAVSIDGDNVYRGAFSPDGREFWFFRKVTEGERYWRVPTDAATGR